ncbi:hypothetical protein L9F63_025496, partial [Diploptera punctata]
LSEMEVMTEKGQDIVSNRRYQKNLKLYEQCSIATLCRHHASLGYFRNLKVHSSSMVFEYIFFPKLLCSNKLLLFFTSSQDFLSMLTMPTKRYQLKEKKQQTLSETG